MTTPGKPVFGRRKPPPPPAPPPAPIAKPPAPSPSRLAELLKIPYDQRPSAWTGEFEKLIVDGYFHQLEPFQRGPDKHDYYTVCVAGKNEPNAMKFLNMAKKCMNNGLGISIFTPGNTKPDFVFTLGELISVAMHKKLSPLSLRWETPERALMVTNEQLIATPDKAFASQVSPDWLPEPARKAMREYLKERYGLTGVHVQGRTEMEGIQVLWKGIIFCFPAPPDCDLNYLTQDLHWFMRPGVASAMLMGLGKADFYPL